MNFEKVKAIMKWLWIAAVFVFVAVYLLSKKATLLEMLSALTFSIVLQAFIAIIIAKFCLVTHMQLSSEKFQVSLSWRESFSIYNLTQLAKYIPGSIWQFVGRFMILKNKGFESKKIRDSIFFEHFWILAIASIFGVVGMLSSPDLFYVWFGEQEIMFTITLVLTVLICIVSFVFGFIIYKKISFKKIKAFWPALSIILNLAIVWFALGVSVWVTLQPYVDVMPSILIITGAFCLAYVLGFLTPFAPAGIGIRELMLVLVLMQFVENKDIAILLAAISRLLYFFVEILFAAFALVSDWRDKYA